MAIPTNSNLQSKKCSTPISSNCIIVEGGVDGVCKGATLTQALYTMSESSNCCKGDFPPGHISAYTGNWVDFSSSIPTSGTFSFGTWATTSGIGGYPPQYKWELNGDLLIRGKMTVSIVSTSPQSGLSIPLVVLSAINFPTNWTASQNILVTTFNNSAGSQTVYQTGSCFLNLDYPTGLLSLNVQFITTTLAPVDITILPISARFNNA